MPLPTIADGVWPTIEKWSFAVFGFVNARGEVRPAGVMYTTSDRILYFITGPDTWKARHIRGNPHVSVTIPVQRLPVRSTKVPPAVITFSGYATVLGLDDIDTDLREKLTHGSDSMNDICAVRVEPVGNFVTYGIGVPLTTMRQPDRSLSRVPVT